MRKALFCAAVAAALFPATAYADVFEGSTTDAVGETTPARDIAAISARYDEGAGAATVSVTLAAPADAGTDALVAAVLARGCNGTPRAVFGASLEGGSARWQTNTMAEGESFTRGGTPPTVTFSVTDPRLANNGYDCLTVVTAPDAESTYDDAEISLTNVTPQPTPTPTATATPTPTPVPTPAPLGPSPLTRAEKLEAALAKCASKKCRTSARNRYGPTKRERYRATLDKCRNKACERRAKARYRGVKAAPKPTGLERRLYGYGASDVMGVCGGICWEALSFVDRRYVYVGMPEGAGVPNCTRVTYDAKEEEGCSTYSVKGKTVTIAATGRRYAIGKDLVRQPTGDETEKTTLERQVFPSAGSRWEVPEIEAIEVWGSALISQTITKTYLTLNRDGQFIRSSYSFGGTGPVAPVTVNFATAPKDTKGTYEVLPAGTIKLTFEDGHTEVGSTFFWDAEKGRDPNNAGLHVIDDTFFGPPDD
jgi:hypothetical protein